MLSRIVFVSLTVGFIVGLALGSSSAHNVAQYPAYDCQYTILSRVFYQSPTVWPDSYNARTADAMAHWNAIPGMSLNRSLAGDAGQSGWGCGESFDLLREHPLAPGIGGVTAMCPSTNSTVRVTMNSDLSWYLGASHPDPDEPSTDFEGIITHEFGHAIRAWQQCTDGDDEDPCEGAHYDKQNNAQICDGPLTTRSTMCAKVASGNAWRQRSLEEHDVDLAQNMY